MDGEIEICIKSLLVHQISYPACGGTYFSLVLTHPCATSPQYYHCLLYLNCVMLA